ncbi:hypothetical protein K440DRAFT_631134 [Wilcoxina mikolae CBS 423.85]|nr:hypothetical protein K440DRAFT_631134 [Wilcoxina mikolae CBS 423.85]
MGRLFAQVPEDVMAAGRKVRYREGIKEMLQLLRFHLPQHEMLKPPLNAYTMRLAAVRHEQGVETLPARKRYIAARRYCSLPTYPAVRSFFSVQPKQADMDSYFAYTRVIVTAISRVLPTQWILGSTPADDRPTEFMLWNVRCVLWNTLDIDWVILVQDANRIGYRSPAERLEVLEKSLQLLLRKVLNVKLKLAGNRERMELLFLVERQGEDEDPEELWESEVCTWVPTFEEGRDAVQMRSGNPFWRR